MPKKKTNKEFLDDLYSKTTNITPLGLYINNNTKISVKCNKCGYEWSTLPRTILSNHGCPKCCGHIKKNTIEFIAKLNLINPNIAVIGEYTGSANKIDVKCKKCGHEWTPTANSITTQRTGCPKCAGNYKLTHEEFVDRLKKISPHIIIKNKYQNSKTQIESECALCGYAWITTASALLSGSGCAKCAGNIRKTQINFIEDLKIKTPTIKVIGDYINARTKIQVRCNECGHEWLSIPNNLMSGEGCPKCANKARILKQTKSEDDFKRQIASINPNIEIIGKYKNSHTKIKCNCKICGNVWNPLAWDLVHGTGCPKCSKTSTSYMEQILLWSLRAVLGENEVISRDNKTIGMELDIFIPKYKLAIEPGSWFWHANKLQNDKRKQEKCNENGIELIIIYDGCKERTIHFSNKNYLIFNVDLGSEQNHVTLKKITENILHRIGKSYIFSSEEWQEIEKLAYKKSRKITTDDFINKLYKINNKVNIIGEYRGVKIKIKCQCRICGREWLASPSHLLEGKGCVKCGGRARKTTNEFIRDLQKINPTIKLLSKEYINNRTKVLVLCNICGNKWEARPANLLTGYGCPKCSRINLSKKRSLTHEQFLEKMKQKGNDNVIVLGQYVKSKEKILCKCKYCKFEWYATPDTLLQGHGCKKCATS